MSTLVSVAIPSPVKFVVISTTLLLADGTHVALRPMQVTDVPAILEMHDRLSSDSIYYRYLHPYKPTVEELERLARLDRSLGAAFVAVITEAGKEKVIGLGYYQTDVEDRTAGQPAFLVEDQFQNRGLGRALARFVTQHAEMNGVRVLDALVHPANRRMMRVIEASGFSYEAKLGYGACEVRVSLQEPSRSE